MLHIVHDIKNYGSPNNADAAPNENKILLIFQKNLNDELTKKKEFVSQVSKRLQ